MFLKCEVVLARIGQKPSAKVVIFVFRSRERFFAPEQLAMTFNFDWTGGT